ncbi:MAG: PAS domain S-box protein [Candidatus Cloacimonetes bacterium]|nr:PAS domain S-box protein [Candidatus Cloacimonadota bacterium]
MLFDQSPVSLWVEDFSLINVFVESLRAEGVTDLRAFFHTYPERFAECVQELKVLDVNNATLRLYKAKSLEELKQNMHKIFQAEAAACIMESIIAIADGRKQFDGQGINYDLEGNKLHFRITWTITGDTIEDYQKVIVAMQDMTHLEKVRKELEERETLFRCIFEQASEGMLLMDASGKILLVNKAMTLLTNLSAKHIVGFHLWDFLR